MGFWNQDKKSEDEQAQGEALMSGETTIDFGEILDISFAAKLYTQLKDEVESNSTVHFITSKLTRIDASCLQVLASFIGYANENEIKIEWPDASDVLKEATRLTGLNEVIRIN